MDRKMISENNVVHSHEIRLRDKPCAFGSTLGSGYGLEDTTVTFSELLTPRS